MEKVKNFKRKSLLKVDTLSEGQSVCSLGSKGSSQVRKVQKLIEETEEIRRKRMVEEFRRNKIKLALVLHKQMYTELELAAICIQKYARRYLAVKTVKKMKFDRYQYELYLRQVQEEIGDFWVVDSSVRHMAAYRIQRYWKGFRKTGLKIDLVQRLAKKVLVQRELHKEKEIRYKKKQAANKIKQYWEIWVLKKILVFFGSWKVFEVQESVDLESEVKDESENSSETKENAEKIEEFTGKEGVNEVISYLIPEKNKLKVIPEFAKPKPFVLSEANFHKQTLVSKVKRFDSPLDIPIKEKKIKKIKSTKRRLSKQGTLKPTNFQEKPKRDKSLTFRKTPETQVRPPPLPRNNKNAQSKIRENFIKQSLRSSSFSIERKESYPKPLEKIIKCSNENQFDHVIEKLEEKINTDQIDPQINKPIEKPAEFTLPTLGFKQALPELYQFLESYKPSHRKNPVVQSAAGLVVFKLKNS